MPRDSHVTMEDDDVVTATVLDPGRAPVPADARIRLTTVDAWVLFAVAVVEVAVAAAGWVSTGLGVVAPVGALVVTNTAMGFASPLCVVLVAAQRLSRHRAAPRRGPFPEPTSRERQIVGLIAAARGNATIRARLGVTT